MSGNFLLSENKYSVLSENKFNPYKLSRKHLEPKYNYRRRCVGYFYEFKYWIWSSKEKKHIPKDEYKDLLKDVETPQPIFVVTKTARNRSNTI